MSSKYKTIEPVLAPWGEVESYEVFQWGVFPRHSVLRGQPCKDFLDEFDTLEEAQKAYPKAEVSDHTINAGISVPDYIDDDPS